MRCESTGASAPRSSSPPRSARAAVGAVLGIGQTGTDLAGVVGQVTFLLPYSRIHETEADRMGVELAARAGYDPRAAITLWQKMARISGGGGPPALLSTHPSNEERIKDLEVFSQRVMPLYEQARLKHSSPGARPVMRFGVYLPTFAWPDLRFDQAARVKAFATGLLILPYYHPVTLAREIQTLWHLSGGRFVLGVGPGWDQHEFETLGMKLAERGRRTDEMIAALRRLLTERDVSFAGRYYRFEHVTIEPRLPRFPELWVGGGSKIDVPVSRQALHRSGPRTDRRRGRVACAAPAPSRWSRTTSGRSVTTSPGTGAIRPRCATVT